MKIEMFVDQIHNIPNIPDVVRAVILEMNKPDPDMEMIASVLKKDQALSLKVLRLVNSAHFGLVSKCGSIDDAVVMLGMKKLQNLILASGLASSFNKIPGIDMKAFWHDSFRVAAYAKWVAENSAADIDGSFTTGLIHNLGRVLIALAKPDEYYVIEEYVAGGRCREKVEYELFGFSSTDISVELARRWHFPETLIEAIALHRAPLVEAELNAEAASVYMASLINDAVKNGSSPEELVEDIPGELLERLSFEAKCLAEQLQEAMCLQNGFDELLAS